MQAEQTPDEHREQNERRQEPPYVPQRNVQSTREKQDGNNTKKRRGRGRGRGKSKCVCEVTTQMHDTSPLEHRRHRKGQWMCVFVYSLGFALPRTRVER